MKLKSCRVLVSCWEEAQVRAQSHALIAQNRLPCSCFMPRCQVFDILVIEPSSFVPVWMWHNISGSRKLYRPISNLSYFTPYLVYSCVQTDPAVWCQRHYFYLSSIFYPNLHILYQNEWYGLNTHTHCACLLKGGSSVTTWDTPCAGLTCQVGLERGFHSESEDEHDLLRVTKRLQTDCDSFCHNL